MRAGGVEREAVLDDRAAETSDARALLENFDVFAEMCRERDAGDAAAEDADVFLNQTVTCDIAIESVASSAPCPICATTFVPSGSTV